MTGYLELSMAETARQIAVPSSADDKYSRGVLGVITGSAQYPGAAVLGVEAAVHTGVGMLRYRGTASELVLQRRPEAVTSPGRVQAWLLGSGIDSASRDSTTTERLLGALREGVPSAIDSGALDLLEQASGPVVITPHFRELANLLGEATANDIAADPAHWCAHAADRLRVTVLLKGNRTHVAAPDGQRLVCAPATTWLATAGTGDALGGILGALLATHSAAVLREPQLLAVISAAAANIHAAAAERASGGGPLTVLDLTAAIPATIAELLQHPLGR